MKATHLRILAVAAVLVLAVAGLAQGMHRGPMGQEFPFGGHMLHFFSDYLDLTSAQQEQVKSIMEKEKPAIRSAMQQMGQFHSQMRALEESSTFDEAKVRTLAAQQSQAMTEMIVQKARIKNEILQVLTADQRTKLAQFEAKREQRMRGHMHRGQDPNSN